MPVYILLPVVMAVLGAFLCTDRAGKTGKAIYSELFGLAIYVVLAFRSFVGSDYKSYSQLYNYFNFVEIDEVTKLAHEKGFVIPLEILSNGFENYRTLFAYTGIIIAVLTALYVYLFSENPSYGALSFICFGPLFYSMNFIRQFIAGLLIAYAMDFIRKKNFFRYLAVIMFASCFHWSALVMIPFYFILKIKLEPITLAEYTVIAIMLFVFSGDMINIGLNTLYTKYLTEYTPDISSGISWSYLIGYGLILIISFLFRKRLYKRSELNQIYMSCMFFVVMFELLGAKYAMLSRFGLLFVIPAVMGLIPELITVFTEYMQEKMPDRKRTACAIALSAAVVFSAGFYGRLISINSNGVVPYRTIFEYSEELW